MDADNTNTGGAEDRTQEKLNTILESFFNDDRIGNLINEMDDDAKELLEVKKTKLEQNINRLIDRRVTKGIQSYEKNYLKNHPIESESKLEIENLQRELAHRENMVSQREHVIRLIQNKNVNMDLALLLIGENESETEANLSKLINSYDERYEQGRTDAIGENTFIPKSGDGIKNNTLESLLKDPGSFENNRDRIYALLEKKTANKKGWW